MDDKKNITKPKYIEEIIKRASEINFNASCDELTGNILRVVAASKDHAEILELGTGVGLSTAWILKGMSSNSKLVSVEMEEAYSNIATEILVNDLRVTFLVEDGGNYIEANKEKQFDLIFADTWPGKFYLLDEVLEMIKPKGIYLIDDLNPQPNWPDGHDVKVKELIEYLESRSDFLMCKLDWSTGLIIMTKKE